MISISRTTAYQPRQVIHALLVCTGLLLGCYMYFLSSAVVQVVVREETEQTIQHVRSEINVLESKYIAAQHRVSEQISMLEGYNEITDKTFIDRRSPSLVMGTTR